MTERTTGRGVCVAVIDSGVNPGHSHIDASTLLPGVAINGDGSIGNGPDATLDRLGHGTAVMAAIQEKAPGATCIPVRVFQDGLKTTGLALIAAIDWAVAGGADIVNLSLGSTNPTHAKAFEAAVERATNAGVIVVAPCQVDDVPCYPGALDHVLPVDVDWDCPREIFRPAPGKSGAFLASGYPRSIPGVPTRRNLYGISFATAQMSGFAALTLEKIPETVMGAERIETVRALLAEQAT